MDKNILRDKLTQKYTNIVMSEFVQEAYNSALPFNKDEMSGISADLRVYQDLVLEAYGGGQKLLSTALQNETDPMKRGYLTQVQSACTEIVTEAVERTISETDIAKELLPEVVDKAALSESEINQLAGKKEELSFKAIGDMINKKVLTTIKAEKEAFDESEELREELHNALGETKDYADTSLESFLDMRIPKTAPKSHISLFSRMMDHSLSTLSACESVDEFCLPAIEAVTAHFIGNAPMGRDDVMSALKARASFSKATESDDHDDEDHRKKYMKKMMNAAMVSTITMYTLFETLYTLNLLKIDPAKIREFIDRPVNFDTVLGGSDEEVTKKANFQLDLIRGRIGKASNTIALEDQAKAVEQWTALIDSLPKGHPIQEAIGPKVDDLQRYVKDRLNALTDTNTSFSETLESAQYYRDRDRALADLNRIASLYRKNPLVSEIQIKVCSAMESSAYDDPIVDVAILGDRGARMDAAMIEYRHNSSAGKFLDCLRAVYDESDLPKSGLKVGFYNVDTCKTV